jgi:hypothetical protein
MHGAAHLKHNQREVIERGEIKTGGIKAIASKIDNALKSSIGRIATYIGWLVVIGGAGHYFYTSSIAINKYLEEDKSFKVHVYTSLEDIHKQLALQKKNQEDLLNDNSCYWLSDSTGATIEVGSNSVQLMGRDSKDLLKYNWKKFVVQEDLPIVEAAITRALSEGSDFSCTFRMYKPRNEETGISDTITVEATADRVFYKNRIIFYSGRLTLKKDKNANTRKKEKTDSL